MGLGIVLERMTARRTAERVKKKIDKILKDNNDYYVMEQLCAMYGYYRPDDMEYKVSELVQKYAERHVKDINKYIDINFIDLDHNPNIVKCQMIMSKNNVISYIEQKMKTANAL